MQPARIAEIPPDHEERAFWRAYHSKRLRPMETAREWGTLVAAFNDFDPVDGGTVHYVRIKHDIYASSYAEQRAWEVEGCPGRYFTDDQFEGWFDPKAYLVAIS